MLFRYGNSVKIVNGFHKGKTGIVVDYDDFLGLPFLWKEYLVYAKGIKEFIWIKERNLKKMSEKK